VPEQRRKCRHGAIVKLIATNICGSDLHMVRGRIPPKVGTVLGHEMTGEIVEVGPDVENFKPGDLVSVPFNVACGRCRNCFEGFTSACLNTNPLAPGGFYGYYLGGGWQGGQSEYQLVPYADFNLLSLGSKSQAMSHILDLSFLSDILPTAFDACYRASVQVGDTVYIAGAGPVGLTAAACCLQLLGAGNVIVSDYEAGRLKLAQSMGCQTVDMNSIAGKTHGLRGMIRSLLGGGKLDPLVEAATGGEKYVDVAIDATGFECCGHHGISRQTNEERSEAINDIIRVCKPAGHLGIPAVYLPGDEGVSDTFGKVRGGLTLDWGIAWQKGLTITQGQCPVKKYNYHLMNAIYGGRLQVAKYLNTRVISLDEAPAAYQNFSQGAAVKYVIDPHNMIPMSARKAAMADPSASS
jgi:glutathione-independent formaldehyde dehydrogenase